jgi:hypothetical protein
MVERKTQSGNCLMAYSWPVNCPWRPGTMRLPPHLRLRTSSLHITHCTLPLSSSAHPQKLTAIWSGGQGKMEGPGMLSEWSGQPRLNIFIKRQDESCNTSRITGCLWTAPPAAYGVEFESLQIQMGCQVSWHPPSKMSLLHWHPVW